jgi:hypothetical protein
MTKRKEWTTTCGAKTRSGDACRLPAGWGTDHPGTGRCKLHGGVVLRGSDNPNYRHGLYSEELSEEDKVAFAEFCARFALAEISNEEMFVFFQLMRSATAQTSTKPDEAAKILQRVASWRRTHHEMLAGKKVVLSFADGAIETLLDDMAAILLKYVPDEHRKAALDELKRVGHKAGTAGTG